LPATPPFKTLLIANRGEIACRIARTAQRLGMRAVAVYSDADVGALHTRVPDAAIRIGPARARDSYLNIDAIIAAAREAKAEAIHPGYGFLSQSAEFAEACGKAGIVFVGPPPSATRLMGVKDQAKALMQKAGVPIVPGYFGAAQEDALLSAEAAKVGYPLLIKAVAGGGGKGMRVVRAPGDFAAALSAARGEAERSFGDARVMLERYIEHARHVEVQVLADRHGNCLHLLERDCSLQRRYQKVIEEAPAPDLAPETRSRLHAAAVAAARAVGYENAGTVEFVVDGREFFFLEMNTRLQVEHPVTEMILGLDLVELQLRVAAGEKLTLKQDEIRPHGHAFEARVYAEDPRRNFLPSGGRVRELQWPQAANTVRVDAAVAAGDRVVIDYDALLAKLIVWGNDRGQALAGLRRALRECRIDGVTTNLAALIALAENEDVANARVYTRLIDERGESLLRPAASQAERAAAIAAGSLLARPRVEAGRATSDDGVASSTNTPWDSVDGWTVQGGCEPVVRFESASGETLLMKREAVASADLRAGFVRVDPDRVTVWLDGEWHRFDRVSAATHLDTGSGEGVIRAPMPGVILAVRVTDGDSVARGHALVVMEAMKMEHTLTAGHAGTVAEVGVRVGDRVREGDVLLSVKAPKS
jgi:3-methylcrotonyl-CoA carboxylase alpha subunit